MGMTVLPANLGVLIPQAEVLFDVSITNVNASSYVNRYVAAVLASAEEAKKRKFLSAAELRYASVTPFVDSIDRTLGHEALVFLQCLAEGCQLAGVKVMVAC